MSVWTYNKSRGFITSDDAADGYPDCKREDFDWMGETHHSDGRPRTGKPMTKEEIDAFYERTRYGGTLVCESIKVEWIGEWIAATHNSIVGHGNWPVDANGRPHIGLVRK